MNLQYIYSCSTQVFEDLMAEYGRHFPGPVLQVKMPRPPNLLSAAQVFGSAQFGKVRVAGGGPKGRRLSFGT